MSNSLISLIFPLHGFEKLAICDDEHDNHLELETKLNRIVNQQTSTIFPKTLIAFGEKSM